MNLISQKGPKLLEGRNWQDEDIIWPGMIQNPDRKRYRHPNVLFIQTEDYTDK